MLVTGDIGSTVIGQVAFELTSRKFDSPISIDASRGRRASARVAGARIADRSAIIRARESRHVATSIAIAKPTSLVFLSATLNQAKSG
jgi:hypothetical protein